MGDFRRRPPTPVRVGVIGITIVNAKWLLGQEGKVAIMVPSLIEPDADELAAVLAAA